MKREPGSSTGFALAQTRRTLPIALLRAREAVMERFRPMLRDIGMTEQQWRVMRVLAELGETDATELAAQACILAPSLTRILRTLTERGFVTGNRASGDARRLQLSLTADGLRFMTEASPRSAQIYAGIESDLGGDQIHQLLDGIERLLERLEARQAR
ncbi:MAG: homoprotocatechuate degradation operon regulator HpaR [Burkholderiaceae bacterium]